jgi:hypothetical protein
MWIGKFFIIVASGMVGANGIPHFVKGVIGQRHQSPFGKPSSAVVNVVWGALNFFGALWLGFWASSYGISFRLGATLVVGGALVAGLGLALGWQNDPVARGEESPAPTDQAA